LDVADDIEAHRQRQGTAEFGYSEGIGNRHPPLRSLAGDGLGFGANLFSGRFMTRLRYFAAVVFVVIAAAFLYARLGGNSSRTRASAGLPMSDAARVEALTQLERREAKADEEVWPEAILGESLGNRIIEVWDALRRADGKFTPLRGLVFDTIHFPAGLQTNLLPHAIRWQKGGSSTNTWSGAEFLKWIDQREAGGFRLEQSEWRNVGFEHPPGATNAVSRFQVTAHAARAASQERFILRAEVRFHWNWTGSPNEARVDHIEVRNLEILSRTGAPMFAAAGSVDLVPRGKAAFIDPVLIRDLDGDGRPEIILAGDNLYLSWDGAQLSGARRLLSEPPDVLYTAVIGDFNGDGRAAMLCASPLGLTIYPGTGSPSQPFGPGELAWAAPSRIQYGQVLTAGDFDGDGRLDVWLGQYKPPYVRGQMPHPFYDANDGFPAYLLRNQGKGEFVDATLNSGLEVKRFRRAYSASFVDLDGDGKLDLVMVSDFAGVDAFLNQGGGRFADVGEKLFPKRLLFGMSHVIADFDGDGALDFLAVGMNAPAAERLDGLALGRGDRIPNDVQWRREITFGNRMYLKRGAGFTEAPLNFAWAKTGWSWGASAFDFDNDGALDIAIVNGHSSNASAKDYENQFWRHDIYVGGSEDNPVADLYFRSAANRFRGHGDSYGGYEKNRLIMNLGGTNFVEIGYLAGVSLEEDCRNLVAADLDGDGREDLVLTTFEVWPAPRQSLRVFKNETPGTGNWLEFQLRDYPGGYSPQGATITLETSERPQIRAVVSGDSHRSQSPAVAHFGLGKAVPKTAFVHWPNRKAQRLEISGANQVIAVPPP
jgi:hypothetical protein